MICPLCKSSLYKILTPSPHSPYVRPTFAPPLPPYKILQETLANILLIARSWLPTLPLPLTHWHLTCAYTMWYRWGSHWYCGLRFGKKNLSGLQHSASAVLPSMQHCSDNAAHCIQHTGGLICLPSNGCRYFLSLTNTSAAFSNQMKALSTGQKYQLAKVHRFKMICLRSCVSGVNATVTVSNALQYQQNVKHSNSKK